MTVKHVAWLKFKDGVPAERIEHHLAACRALVGRVPVVINLECGPNFTDRADGFTHCIIVTLANREAIPEYLNHPEHIPVVDALKEDVADLRVMDVQL